MRLGEVDDRAAEFMFFVEAEDGIRNMGVTGVQACALPIPEPGSSGAGPPGPAAEPPDAVAGSREVSPTNRATNGVAGRSRSEERRVGEECRSRWSAYH